VERTASDRADRGARELEALRSQVPPPPPLFPPIARRTPSSHTFPTIHRLATPLRVSEPHEAQGALEIRATRCTYICI
jgi:hypothetical protein